MAHVEARPRVQDTGHVGRFARLSESIAGSMRTVKLGFQERSIIAQRFMKPLPLQSFEHAQLGRAMGRLVAGIYDPRRIHNREFLLLKSKEGKLAFLETFRELVTDVAVKGVREGMTRADVEKVVHAKFETLAERVKNQDMSVREFLVSVNRVVKESLAEVGANRAVKNSRDLINTYFLSARVIKGSDGRVAILDALTGKAYLVSKDGKISTITVTDEDVNKTLSEKGITPESASRNVREIESLRILISSLRKEGFKVKESTLVDVRENMVAGRAIIESISSGKDVRMTYEKMISEDLRSDPEFHRLYQEKATKEIIKSIETASLTTAFMDSFTKLPAKFTAMMSRVLAAISRYVPVVGAIASVGGELATTFLEYGEQVSEKLRNYGNARWSLKDLASEKISGSPIIDKLSLNQNQQQTQTPSQVQHQPALQKTGVTASGGEIHIDASASSVAGK